MTLSLYGTILLVVIFGCVTFLTYTGKIPSHTISTLIGIVVGWLLKTGATTVAEVRARSSPPPPPQPASATFDENESPTARDRRSNAVTVAMPAAKRPDRNDPK